MLDRLQAALSGRYNVERELGAGGMATVYLADDPKHDRKVAVKVLHPELSAVIGAERFLAEIRTTANLQHPHILPLFDSGEADGLLFYVMPYVDGESLRDRLDRERQLPVKEAVRITSGVASALDYAHRQGIVHRDIKPANILLHDGQPIVADFGIALALTAAGSGGRMTETGLSLGTPHYMSPEQASGEGTVDPRSDVYALGCVLYEMLVGDPPFPGSTPQAVLAKVLTTEPDRTTVHRAAVPPHVDSVVARAMERIPADRFESIAELQAALADEGFRHGRLAGSNEGERGWAPGPVIAAVTVLSVLVVVLGVTTWMGWSGSAYGDPAGYRVLRLGDDAAGFDVAYRVELSPDGRLAAGVDTLQRLHLVSLDGSPVGRLPDLTRIRVPRFSPDGSRIGFVSVNGVQPDGAQLFWIPASGAGSATLIGAMPGPGWVWGLDGDVYFARNGEIRRYASPGAPEETPPQPDGLVAEPLQTLPDGRLLIETPTDQSGNRIGILDPVTGELTTPESQPDPLGTRDARYHEGYLFWTTADGILYAARFDLGGAGVVSPRIEIERSVAPASQIGSLFSVAADGSVVVGLGSDGRAGEGENLAWVDFDGNTEVLHEPWAEEFQDFDNAAPSPDGRWIAVEVDGAVRTGEGEERAEIWILDVAQTQSYRLTFDGAATMPQWLPDGRVAYLRDADRQAARVVAQPFDRSGTEEVVVDLDQVIHAFDVIPDGSGLVLEVHEADRNDDDIWVARFDGTPPERWLAEGFDEGDPVISPNGEWVAYISFETGRPELYARSFPTAGRPWRLSDEGVGEGVVWDPDGRWIYFPSNGMLQARFLAFDDGGIQLQGNGEFFSLNPFEIAPKAMDAAGERFLMVVEPATATGMRQRIHLNVFSEIERRIAAEGGR